MTRIHYSGRLELVRNGKTITIAEGYAACARGDAAIRIRDMGAQTDDPDEVSCARCRKLIAEALGDSE